MHESTAADLDSTRQALLSLDCNTAEYATRFIDQLLGASCRRSVSDIHIQPADDLLEVRWRVDGVLQEIGRFPRGTSTDPVTRLKVLAELLTYQQDVPQEGRIRDGFEGIEMRVSTFPTLEGERAVVRLFAVNHARHHLNDLGFPAELTTRLRQLLVETSGVIIVTGPAGSGKTTTGYACLREVVEGSKGGRSIVSLEDPIEVAVRGVSQSQVNSAANFTLSTGLRSLLRQDPEVIFVGEIRDQETAEVAFQASLTGQLVLTTFHAGSAAEAISRLGDMGIEPYLLRSGIRGILGQRLVRGLCTCASPIEDEADYLGLDVEKAWTATGCEQCDGSGYHGRIALAELLVPDRNELSRAILSRSDADQLETLAVQFGMTTRWQRARSVVQAGLTSPSEVRRVLGFR